MANKNIKHSYVMEKDKKIAALTDGERNVTMEDYDASQSRNASLVRDLDSTTDKLKTANSTIKVTKDELQKEKAQKEKVQKENEDLTAQNKKVKRTNKVIIAGTSVVMAIALAIGITGTTLWSKSKHEIKAVEDKYIGWVSPDEVSSLRTELESVKAELAALEIENNATKAELEAVKTELKSVQAELLAQKAINTQLAEENKKLQDQLNAANDEIDELLADVQDYLDRIAALESQLAKGDQAGVDKEENNNGNGNVSVGTNDKDNVNQGGSGVDKEQEEPSAPIL